MNQFLIVSILIFVSSFGCQNKTLLTEPSYSPSILQGLTTETATQIAILRHKNQKLSYKVSPEEPFRIETKSLPKSLWVVDHLYFNELNSGTVYDLDVINQDYQVIDSRQFKNLDLTARDLKIAIASCMDQRRHNASIWTDFSSHNSNLQFLIGDNVYGDVETKIPSLASPIELWEKYVEARQTLQLYKSKILTPTLAVWDDHDYGNNGGNQKYQYKNESLRTFYSFFAQDPIKHKHYSKGPGLSFRLTAGGQNFFFMDNRFFRTADKVTPDYHWGQQQQDWLFEQLQSQQKFSWLINGNQFFGGYQRFESFEKNHPTNFVDVINQLKKLKTKVAFISGDRHLTELMKISKADIGYETLELTTSAIHAKVFPSSWDQAPNPRQLYGKANALNYAIIHTQQTNNSTKINIKALGLNQETFYQHQQIIK